MVLLIVFTATLNSDIFEFKANQYGGTDDNVYLFALSVYQSFRNNCLFPAWLSVVGFVDPDIIEIAHFFGSYQNRHILRKEELQNLDCS